VLAVGVDAGFLLMESPCWADGDVVRCSGNLAHIKTWETSPIRELARITHDGGRVCHFTTDKKLCDGYLIAYGYWPDGGQTDFKACR
jgi:hypothetical protein